MEQFLFYRSILDLSTAFDTIDHSLLISRLASIAGNALKWFTSYISDRTSSILINGRISSLRNISYGVPQGSVLGPILFNIYLLPIFDILSKFPLISVHSYADDIQLNVKCTSDINFAPNFMSNCIKSIHTWLSNNSLSLNPNKTETIFLHLPSPRCPLKDV